MVKLYDLKSRHHRGTMGKWSYNYEDSMLPWVMKTLNDPIGKYTGEGRRGLLTTLLYGWMTFIQVHFEDLAETQCQIFILAEIHLWIIISKEIHPWGHRLRGDPSLGHHFRGDPRLNHHFGGDPLPDQHYSGSAIGLHFHHVLVVISHHVTSPVISWRPHTEMMEVEDPIHITSGRAHLGKMQMGCY